jgi:hypothetical protein
MDKNYAPTPKTREIEMPLIKKAFEIIASKVPFSTVPGNHDYDAQWTDSRFPPKLTGPLAPDTAGVLHVGWTRQLPGGLRCRHAVFQGQALICRVV